MIDHAKHADAARITVATYRDEVVRGIIFWLNEMEIYEGDTAEQLREKIIWNLQDALAEAEKP